MIFFRNRHFKLHAVLYLAIVISTQSRNITEIVAYVYIVQHISEKSDQVKVLQTPNK